jgi:hypothetical protein
MAVRMSEEQGQGARRPRRAAAARAAALAAGSPDTPPRRLAMLATSFPGAVLANPALPQLLVENPDLHRRIVVKARLAQFEEALARGLAAADRAVLVGFVAMAALRVLPLYEDAALDGRRYRDALSQIEAAARAPSIETAPAAAAPEGAPLVEGFGGMDHLFALFAGWEREVATFERSAQEQATLPPGARMSLLGPALAAADRYVGAVETRAAETPAPAEVEVQAEAAAATLRKLSLAFVAAEAIDEALAIGRGGDVERIDPLFEAIAEAVYLDRILRGAPSSEALEAVFSELDQQRVLLDALLAPSAAGRSGAPGAIARGPDAGEVEGRLRRSIDGYKGSGGQARAVVRALATARRARVSVRKLLAALDDLAARPDQG